MQRVMNQITYFLFSEQEKFDKFLKYMLNNIIFRRLINQPIIIKMKFSIKKKIRKQFLQHSNMLLFNSVSTESCSLLYRILWGGLLAALQHHELVHLRVGAGAQRHAGSARGAPWNVAGGGAAFPQLQRQVSFPLEKGVGGVKRTFYRERIMKLHLGESCHVVSTSVQFSPCRICFENLYAVENECMCRHFRM